MKNYVLAVLLIVVGACAVSPMETIDEAEEPTTTERRYCRCLCYSGDLLLGLVTFDYDNSQCSTGNGTECKVKYMGGTAYGTTKDCKPVIDDTTAIEIEGEIEQRE